MKGAAEHRASLMALEERKRLLFEDLARAAEASFGRAMEAVGDLKVSLDRETKIAVDDRWSFLLKAARPGEHVVATSTVDPEWWEEPGNVQWLGLNQEAVERGIRFIRLFFVDSREHLADGRVLKMLCDQMKRGIQVEYVIKTLNEVPRDIILIGGQVSNCCSLHKEHLRIITGAFVYGELEIAEDRKRWKRFTISGEEDSLNRAIKDMDAYLARAQRFIYPEWYRLYFDEHYEPIQRIYRPEAERELAFLQAAADLRPDSQVLDLGCGRGRITIPLRQKCSITALDMSEEIIKEMKTLYPNTPGRLEWINQDAKVVPSTASLQRLQGKFDVVVCLFNSFGYFDDANDNRAVIDAVHWLLKPSGHFVLEIDNPHYLRKKAHLERQATSPDYGGELARSDLVSDSRRITQFIVRHRGMAWAMPTVSIELYSPDEMMSLLTQKGFEITLDDLYFDFSTDASFPGLSDPTQPERIIFVARKKSGTGQ
jgi:SAM-dependent methyltransferase